MRNIHQKKLKHCISWALFFSLLCLVTACGGGGGSSNVVVDPPPPPPPPGSNANLAGLGVSSGSLEQIFATDLLDYTVSTGYLTQGIRVYAPVEDDTASVMVNDVALGTDGYSETIELLEGANSAINIVVTAEDGITVKTYTLIATREIAASFASQAYLKASNTETNDEFGLVLASYGDTLAVGAPYEQSAAVGIDGDETDNSADNAGAVYIFTRSAGAWSQQAYIKASNSEFGDRFGSALSIFGDTLVVGAPNEQSGALGIDGDQSSNSKDASGAVYIFVRSAGVWSQEAYIKASNTDSGDKFGIALALSRDTLAVGAPYEQSRTQGIGGDQSSNSEDASGAVYIFSRTVEVWSQQAYIKSSNTEFDDRFGASVSLSGDTLVVGAANEDGGATTIDGDDTDNSKGNSGAVYVFTVAGTTWTQQAYLKASNSEADDQFGARVAVFGNLIAVGAPLEDSAGGQADNSVSNSGALYVFSRTGTSWAQDQYIKISNPDTEDRFGSSIALSGFTLAAGTALEDSVATGMNGDETDNTILSSGAAFLYFRSSAGIWSQLAYIKASNTEFEDQFGVSLALWGGTLIIGANLEDSAATGPGGDDTDNTAPDSGATFVWK